jgi:hypothetical protein
MGLKLEKEVGFGGLLVVWPDGGRIGRSLGLDEVKEEGLVGFAILGLGGARTGLFEKDDGFSLESLEVAFLVNPIRAMNDEGLVLALLPEGGLLGGFFFGIFLLVAFVCACLTPESFAV